MMGWSWVQKVPKEDWGVHETHCCVIHGCKYGNDEHCPVYKALIEQGYLCETCSDKAQERKFSNGNTNADYEGQWSKVHKEFQKVVNERRVNKLKRVLYENDNK